MLELLKVKQNKSHDLIEGDLSRCQEELVWNKLNLLFFQISLFEPMSVLDSFSFLFIVFIDVKDLYHRLQLYGYLNCVLLMYLQFSHFSFNKNKYSENSSKVYINSQPLSLEYYQDDLVILTYNKLKATYLFGCKIQNMKAANTKMK